MRKWLVVLVLAGFSAGPPAGAVGLQWLAGDTVQVAPHRFDRNQLAIDQPLLGYLSRPRSAGRHPAVVVLHGCDGFAAADVAAADVLKSFGYAALALDSLGDEDACGKLGGIGAEAYDAYAGLDWLAQQSFVDPDRVAVLGFSMGGGGVLDAVGRLQAMHERHFRAGVAFYPPCQVPMYEAGVMSVPTLILIGDKDDWASASQCRNMMTRRDGKGAPVKLVVYAGAMHAFIVAAPARDYRGHHLVYDPQATADAWQQVRTFLQATLAEIQPAGNKPPSNPAAERR
jgi:dienelactone hydrolase